MPLYFFYTMMQKSQKWPKTQFKGGPASCRTPTPLDLSFWTFLTFLHHGIEEVERHLLWKGYKKIRRKSRSNVPPKLLACIRFLYKVVHKIGRLRKFNRSREIEFNFLTAWTIPMKFGTLVQHGPGSKILPQIFQFLPGDLVMLFQSRKKEIKSSLNFERSKVPRQKLKNVRPCFVDQPFFQSAKTVSVYRNY